MIINIHAQIGDELPNLIWNAHELGSMAQAMSSHPCSVCGTLFEQGVDNVKRDHFHGSDVGACARKTYWKMVTGKSSGISGANFLNDGHLHEHSMLANIEAGLPEGYRIYIAKNNTEKRFNAGEFEIINHLDSFLMTPDGIYGLECKSVKQAMWKKIREEQEIPDEWYGQTQSYMITWEMDRWYIFVKHRESSNVLIPIRINRDMGYIAERLNKLREIKERIINDLGQPNREHTHPKDYECLWCPFGSNIGDGRCWSKGD